MRRFTLSAVLIAALLLTACSGAGRPEAEAGAAPAGVDPALWQQLTAALAQSIAENPRRNASLVPSNPQSKVPDFALAESTDVNVTFSWSFRSQGDYDQNGEVNAADLSPLGAFFTATSASPDWPRAQVADGDQNGELTIADITPIGVNFGNRTSGYLLENSSTPEEADSWAMVAAIPLSAGVLPGGGGFKQFTFLLASPAWDSHYRVRPYNGDPQANPELGIPSDYVTTPPEKITRTTFGTWLQYDLAPFGSAHQFFDLDACSLAGRPAVIFYNQETQEVSAAVATSPTPASAADWDIDVLESFRIGSSWGVAIAECAGVLTAATVGLGGNIAFHTYDVTGSWSTHDAVAFGGPFYRYPALAEVAGKPAILVAGSGPDDLYYLRSTVAQPAQTSDWELTHVFSQDNSYTLDLSPQRPFSLCEAAGLPQIAFIVSSAGDRRQRLGRALTDSPAGDSDWFTYEIFPESGYVDLETLSDLPVFSNSSREYYTPTSAVHSSPVNWSHYFPISEFPSIDDAQIEVIDGLSTMAWRQGVVGLRISQAQEVDAGSSEWFVQDLPTLQGSSPIRLGEGNGLPALYVTTTGNQLSYCYPLP